MTQENLVSYRRNQKWINDAILRYKAQKELAYSISSPNLDGMPKAKNKINDSFEKLLDCYNEILDKLYLQQKEQNKLIEQLMRMKDEPKPYRSLLTYFYIDGLSLEETSIKINYSYQKTSTMKNIALNKFDELNESG